VTQLKKTDPSDIDEKVIAICVVASVCFRDKCHGYPIAILTKAVFCDPARIKLFLQGNALVNSR